MDGPSPIPANDLFHLLNGVSAPLIFDVRRAAAFNDALKLAAGLKAALAHINVGDG